MHLILSILLGFSAGGVWAADRPRLIADGETPVYEEPEDGAKVVYYLHAGEMPEVESAGGEYFKIHLRRGGRGLTGFVQKGDLHVPETKSHKWAAGVFAQYSSFVELPKSFQTNDQVQWRTSQYKSTDFNFKVHAQVGNVNFWRLEAGLFNVNYSAIASTSVQGQPSQVVALKQSFVYGDVKKSWSLFSSPYFYFGLGLEVAKATSVNLTLGGGNVPTTSADEPWDISGQFFVGGNWFLTPSYSVTGEIQGMGVVNQSPLVYAYEAAVGLSYWF